MGLIDTITGGFRIAQRRPWLILLPMVVDLWLWLGPRLAVQPFVDGLLALWTPANLPAELGQMVGPYRELLILEGSRFNLWWLVNNSLTWLRLVMPGLAEPAQLVTVPVQQTSTLSLVLWVPFLLVLGLGLGVGFLTAVTSQLRVGQPPQGAAEGSEPVSPSPGFWVRRGLRAWGLAVLYGAVVIAILFAITLLLSLVLAPVMLIAPQVAGGLTTLLALLLAWMLVWLYLMLYFVVAAIVTDGVGLGQAFWRSFNVVTRNFWPTLGLVILTTVILVGFGFIWQRLAAQSPIGTAVAIIGNALLLTGLTAARLLFYKDRSARWLEAQANQQAAVRPPNNT